MERPVKFRTRRRYEIPWHARYLTFSCWQEKAFLSKDFPRRWFRDAVLLARRRHPFGLLAWVIMPEHVHLLLVPIPPSTVAEVLYAIKSSVAKKAVAHLRHTAPHRLATMLDRQPSGRACYRFWQPGGGYDRNIWSVRDVHEKIGYIHNNPIRRGLVVRPEEWAWSSWQAWQMGIDDPLPIDRDMVPPLER